MRRFKIFWMLSFILFILPAKGFSEEKEKKHPIDVWLEKCMEKENYTTAGMLSCSSQALDKWDKELNRVYKELMKKLSPEEKELLKQSQQQWIKFRDAEFKFLDNLYLGTGTMIPVMIMGDKLDIISERVKMLEGYLNYINDWYSERQEHFKTK
ncbi:MAG: DUF1311 domain-containing protein [Sulfurihydrogenibium sp.]|nr:DUF1311 domain-containing protein [Sulfurihydrogenibium sp.]